MPCSDYIAPVNRSMDRTNCRKRKSFDSVCWLQYSRSGLRAGFSADSLWLELAFGLPLPAEVPDFEPAVRPRLISWPLPLRQPGLPAILDCGYQALLTYGLCP